MDQGFLAGPHFCKNTACRARPDLLSVFFTDSYSFCMPLFCGINKTTDVYLSQLSCRHKIRKVIITRLSWWLELAL